MSTRNCKYVWSLHKCAVSSCSVKDRKLSNDLTWHLFPQGERNKKCKQKWTQILQVERADSEWQPSATQRICSRHFKENCFKIVNSKRRLLPDAVPFFGTNDPRDMNNFVDDETVSANVNFIAVTGNCMVTCPNCDHQFAVKNNGSEDSEPINKKRKTPVKAEDATCSTSEISFKPVTPTSMSRLKLEHNYIKSPRTAASTASETSKKLVKKCQAMGKKIQRRNLAIQTVKDELQKSKLLSEQRLTSLENQFPNILKKLILNEETRLQTKGKTGMRYDEEIKKFAVTLHYYSPRAYDFVREYLCLPHPSTLTSWMRSSNCGPGFNIDVIEKIWEAKQQLVGSQLSDVLLQVDEMAIRKDTCWDPTQHKYIGFVDFGTGELTGDEPLATNALVCLLAGLTGGWKVSLGYVLSDKVDGTQMKEFVSQAFQLLEDKQFNVYSLTSDGNTANVGMFTKLGVEEGFRTYAEIVNDFPNPANPDKRVCCVYDFVHMFKLWRNLLSQCQDIRWEYGSISWKYITEVHKLQEIEQIVAANKLNRYHLEFEKHKMKVKYAVQTLSKSVADAIDFCRQDLKLPQFQGSKSTTMFIRKLDAVFDILNSRHPAQFGNKGPLRNSNIIDREKYLREFAQNILKMTYTEKRTYKGQIKLTPKLIAESSRKRAVLGTVITIKSVLQIAFQVLQRDEHPLSYVLTYRFCQDLLELFFNKVRGRCGRNDNPNAVEFKNIMKQIWHQNLLKSTSTGNCIVQQVEGEIPGGLLPLKRRPKARVPENDFDPTEVFPEVAQNDDTSLFYKNCLAYIAGSIVRKLAERLDCEDCKGQMFNSLQDPLPYEYSRLIKRKTCGGLITPSKSVFSIVQKADELFWHLVKINNGPPRVSNLDLKLSIGVTKCLIGVTSLFPSAADHVVDFDPAEGETHLSTLIKAITKQFVNIRLYDFGRRYQRSLNVSLRHSLTKQITLIRHE